MFIHNQRPGALRIDLKITVEQLKMADVIFINHIVKNLSVYLFVIIGYKLSHYSY